MSKFRMATKLVIVLALLVSMALVAETAHAEAGAATERTTNFINDARGANGLSGLARSWDLDAVARQHSARMAGAGGIFHNGSLAAEVPNHWAALAENVGVGPSEDAVHNGFMNSPGHRANILGGYDKVGIGVVESGGLAFITEVFWKSADQASYSAPAKAKSCRKVKGRTRCTSVKKYKKKSRKVSKARRRRR